MEKWKIGAIAALLCCLLGAGFYRQIKNALRPILRPNAEQKLQRMVGRPVPQWDLAAPLWINTTQPIKPEDVQGHVTLIEFFRVNCPYCREMAPFIKELNRKYAPRGLKIIAFQAPGTAANENNWQQVKNTLLTDWKLPYPVAFDEKSTLFKGSFSGAIYPTTLVLDRQGIVRFAQIGNEAEGAKALEDFIKQQLATSPTAKSLSLRPVL